MKKDISKLNDEELFVLLQQNNNKALEILFRKYYVRLCNFSVSYVKKESIAEEVVSDIFLNIWLKRRTIRIRTSLKAYLFAAVRNRSLNYAIKEKLKFEKLDVIDEEKNIALNNTPMEIMAIQELENVIEKVIRKLPPKRQLIFRMNKIEGLKYKEIAKVLAISVSTVQNHMVKANKFISNYYSFIKSLYLFLFYFLLKI